MAGGAANLDRSREADHVHLYADYFHLESVLYRNYFRHRFRMSRNFFGRIIEVVCLHDLYFRCKLDATAKFGFSYCQKCSAAIRMLAYGVAGSLVYEYMCMSGSICIESMYKFLSTYHFGLRRRVLARAQHGGHSTSLVHQWEEGVSRYAWKHRLYALGVE
jgi:hypothetical protein